MKPVKILIVGAGDRGKGYSQYALEFPEKMKVIGVAEPDEYRRKEMIKMHGIKTEFVFNNWKDAAKVNKFADAVIIATQDKMHTEPAIAFAEKGYHILLEKPMAPTEEECRQIVEKVKENEIMFAVCHVMRYTNYTQKLKQIIDEGQIGDIVTFQHLEPVGFWHQAHSFVRGNWRRTDESNFMLMAKSCHDLDWINYIVGKKCIKVSSFGSLKYFRKENQPEGAADRCWNCPDSVENECPYSAKRIYLEGWHKGWRGWPLTVIADNPDPESIEKALKEGPYGRCVFKCDNDVVDNQVVNFEFKDGSTGTFTMTAFTELTGRRTRIFGTKGELEGDGRYIRIFDFLTQQKHEIDTLKESFILKGHGGGDFGLMKAFIDAILTGDESKIISGADETLESHLLVFNAEKARLNQSVHKEE